MSKSMRPPEDTDKVSTFEVACQVRNHLTGKPCGQSAVKRVTIATSRQRVALDACDGHVRALRSFRGVTVVGAA